MNKHESVKEFLAKRDFSSGIANDLTNLRDFFAAAALNGFLAHGAGPNDRSYVIAAYDYAEMMLQERKGRA
jgi:hypothetical protein